MDKPILLWIFFWFGIFCYSIGFIFYLISFVFKKDNALNYAFHLSISGFVFQTIYIILRWIMSGHPPVLGVFENSLWSTWFVVLSMLVVSLKRKGLRSTGVIVIPLVLLILGNGLMSGETAIEPLPPPFQSTWLWVHAISGWLAFGPYAISAGMAAVYLLKKDTLGKALLDDLILKFIGFGFIMHSVMIISGAIWAYELWGRYWAWDPIETWSLISWLIYGINLHLRLTLGWKGAKAAWLALISLISVIIVFFGVGFIASLHTGLL
jgi:ABC-type transport system involved in cytochrome c biogenesis permease subunit